MEDGRYMIIIKSLPANELPSETSWRDLNRLAKGNGIDQGKSWKAVQVNTVITGKDSLVIVALLQRRSFWDKLFSRS